MWYDAQIASDLYWGHEEPYNNCTADAALVWHLSSSTTNNRCKFSTGFCCADAT